MHVMCVFMVGMEYIIKGIIHDRVILIGKKTPLVPIFISQRQFSEPLRFYWSCWKGSEREIGRFPISAMLFDILSTKYE